MNKICFAKLLVFAALALSACKTGTTVPKSEISETKDTSYATTGSVERISPAMDEIIPPGALPEILADGFKWTEGPVWLPDQDILLFSDIPNNSVFQWSERTGLKLYLKPAGTADTTSREGETGSNGLLLDKNGQLVLCQHGDRRMARMDAPLDNPQPRYINIVDKWQGKRLNSPNDAIFNSRGDLFFTDPPYGLEKSFNDPKRELKFSGIFKFTAEGELILLSDKMSAPNGIGLSPDEKKLYIGNSGEGDKALWMEFAINSDGSLDKGKVFYDPSKSGESGGPDGLKVRSDGTIFATGPGGVWVFAQDGQHLGTIKTGQPTANCAWDEDGNYLYITANMYLMRIRLK